MSELLAEGFTFPSGARWVEIPNHVSCGMSVLEALVCELQTAGFEPRQIKIVEMAFTEALINAVRHGNQDDPSKTVLIEYRIDANELHLAIEDEGSGFALDEIADPTLPENRERPGGRGLLMIRSLVDDVAFNRPGNRIVMRQSRCARAA